MKFTKIPKEYRGGFPYYVSGPYMITKIDHGRLATYWAAHLNGVRLGVATHLKHAVDICEKHEAQQ
jgi:hypothetical protein